MNALETLIADHADIREKIFNKKTIQKILLKFYDEDIVEEETFHTWHSKASKRYSNKTIAKEIREMSKDFIEWLKTAEESSSEDDDSANNDQLPEPEVKKLLRKFFNLISFFLDRFYTRRWQWFRSENRKREKSAC